MKLTRSLVLLGLAALCLGRPAFVETSATNTAPLSLLAPPVLYHPTNAPLLWRSSAHSNRPAVVILEPRKPVAAQALKPSSSNSTALLSLIPHALLVPNPGVYKTEPYAGIVVVPEEHLDDRAIINAAQGNLNMPVLKP